MPRTKSAIRAARVSEKRQARNRSLKTASKSAIVRAEKAMVDNNLEAAQKEVIAASSALDKAVKKKVIHRNTAARRKSRLAKKLVKTQAVGASKTTEKK